MFVASLNETLVSVHQQLFILFTEILMQSCFASFYDNRIIRSGSPSAFS